MNVTREVIYDLLPAYFAGEASADTRALVDGFFATDPEFAHMAKRFQAAAGRASPADAERESFRRTRARVGLRYAAMAWAASALFAFGIATVTITGGRGGFLHPGVIIGGVFAASAVATWLASYSKNSAWWYDALSGKTD